MADLMYVTASDDDVIGVYDVDRESGKIAKKHEISISGRPAPLVVDSSNNFLFVGRRDINTITSYAIDLPTGNLEEISSTKLEADPCYLSTDRTGRFLLSAYYNGGAAAVHEIQDGGELSSSPVEWRKTATGAHCLQTDPSNQFAFLPHIAGGTGPNTIMQFLFDDRTGHLTPNEPAEVFPGEENGPRHYCFHPTLDVVYFSNEQGCSVSAYHLNTNNGTLGQFQTVSTLPDDYSGTNSCAQIGITSNGRFLFAPNRGHNSLACFAVNAESGELNRVDIVAAEPVPRAFTIDRAGKFLYSCGLESGKMRVFAIQQDSGSLDVVETQSIGNGPMWTLIVPRDA